MRLREPALESLTADAWSGPSASIRISVVSGIGEALRRGVDNGGPAPDDGLLVGELLQRGERAIHAHRVNPVREEVIDLVFHQRDERADDDGDPIEGEGGELEAQALAGAGRHDDERIAAAEGVVHGLGLAGAKLAKAEVIADAVAEGFFFGGVRAAGMHLGSVVWVRGVRMAPV